MNDDVTLYIKHLLPITLLNMWIPDATQPLAVSTAAAAQPFLHSSHSFAWGWMVILLRLQMCLNYCIN